jgi:guanylate kinase
VRDGVGGARVSPMRVLGLFGPSGAGKTTLARLLAARWPDLYEPAPTVSTRAARPDDAGVYVTVTEAEFDQLASAGEFIAITEIRASAERRLYAYRRRDAEATAARGRTFVAPLESQLTRSLRTALGPRELFVVGLMPPGATPAERIAALGSRLAPRYPGVTRALADRLANAADEDLPLLEAAARVFAGGASGPVASIDAIVTTDTTAEETAARIHDLARAWLQEKKVRSTSQ